jgi:hypothetical protein
MKKTFKELREETEAARWNSNLQNLASADAMITEGLDRLATEKARLEQLRKDIEEAGNNPETLTYERTRDLYDSVRPSKSGRW